MATPGENRKTNVVKGHPSVYQTFVFVRSDKRRCESKAPTLKCLLDICASSKYYTISLKCAAQIKPSLTTPHGLPTSLWNACMCTHPNTHVELPTDEELRIDFLTGVVHSTRVPVGIERADTCCGGSREWGACQESWSEQGSEDVWCSDSDVDNSGM